MKALKFLPIIITTIVLFGCSTKVCMSTGGMEISKTEGEPSTQFIDDPCFGKWLRVESALAERSPSGMLVAQVELRNIWKDVDDDDRGDDFTAQYIVRWFDKKGIELPQDEMIWQCLTWHGGESRSINAVAPMPEASRYVLRLRHAR